MKNNKNFKSLAWTDVEKLLETKAPFFDFQDSYGRFVGDSLLHMELTFVNV